MFLHCIFSHALFIFISIILCIIFTYVYIAFESFGFLGVDSKNDQPSDDFIDSKSSKTEVVSTTSNEKRGLSRKRKLSSENLAGLKYFKSSSIKAEFLDMKKQLEDMLLECDPQRLFKECITLMASEAHNIPLITNENYLQSLNECNVAPAILQKLSPFFTWSDHSVLTAVVKACNNPDAALLLQQFDAQVDLSLPITEYPVPQPIPSMAPYDTSMQTVLAVKLNTELRKFSLQQVIELRCLIQKHFQITEHSLQLMAAQSSSTVIYWMIPKCISHLINFMVMQDPSLHGSRVEEISVYPGTLFVSANSLKLGSLAFLNKINQTVN